MRSTGAENFYEIAIRRASCALYSSRMHLRCLDECARSDHSISVSRSKFSYRCFLRGVIVMTNLIRINDEIINSDSFVKLLKLSGRFDALIDDIVQEKLAVHAAKKHGIKLTPESVQQRSDQLRRVNG